MAEGLAERVIPYDGLWMMGRLDKYSSSRNNKDGCVEGVKKMEKKIKSSETVNEWWGLEATGSEGLLWTWPQDFSG